MRSTPRAHTHTRTLSEKDILEAFLEAHRRADLECFGVDCSQEESLLKAYNFILFNQRFFGVLSELIRECRAEQDENDQAGG